MPSGQKYRLLGDCSWGCLLELEQADNGFEFTYSHPQSSSRTLHPNWATRFGFVVIESLEFGVWKYDNVDRTNIELLTALRVPTNDSDQSGYASLLDTQVDMQSSISRPQRAWLRHLVTEQRRIQLAVEAISDSKPIILGNLLDQSEFSLKSVAATPTSSIESQIALITRQRGVLGARRFHAQNNCIAIIALIESAHYQQIVAAITNEFGRPGAIQQIAATF